MKQLFFIATITLLFSSCNQDEIDKSKAEAEKTKVENDSLKVLINERETSINDFVSSFDEIEQNLDSITVKQNIISLNSGKPSELKSSKKDKINQEIKAINELMTDNYKKIAQLNKKLKNSGYKNAQLEKTIATLNEQITAKNAELAELNDRLNGLNGQVTQLQMSLDTLIMDNNAKSKNIAEETAALHTAYYVIGESKELVEAKIIDKKGGLLGIGTTPKLNENIDKSKFTQIDYTQMEKITINGEGVKVVTTHPADSYTLDKDAEDKKLIKSLTITDPEKFWSASKFLVIIKS